MDTHTEFYWTSPLSSAKSFHGLNAIRLDDGKPVVFRSQHERTGNDPDAKALGQAGHLWRSLLTSLRVFELAVGH
jgi:hypothetical protein